MANFSAGTEEIFKMEWDKICKILNNSGKDLSQIPIAPKAKEDE